MKYAIVATMLLISSPVFAQSKEYVLKLSTEEVNIIGKLLEAQPYRDVAALVAKLRAQIVAQEKQDNK